MLQFIIIGAGLMSIIGFALEHFASNELIRLSIVSSKLDFYLYLLVIYAVLLIPLFILSSPSRTETVKTVGQAAGFAFLDIVQWISIGILIAIGFNAFN